MGVAVDFGDGLTEGRPFEKSVTNLGTSMIYSDSSRRDHMPPLQLSVHTNSVHSSHAGITPTSDY